MAESQSAEDVSELLDLLRFRRLDARNGSICSSAAVHFCGEVADALERLEKKCAALAFLLYGSPNECSSGGGPPILKADTSLSATPELLPPDVRVSALQDVVHEPASEVRAAHAARSLRIETAGELAGDFARAATLEHDGHGYTIWRIGEQQFVPLQEVLQAQQRETPVKYVRPDQLHGHTPACDLMCVPVRQLKTGGFDG